MGAIAACVVLASELFAHVVDLLDRQSTFERLALSDGLSQGTDLISSCLKPLPDVQTACCEAQHHCLCLAIEVAERRSNRDSLRSTRGAAR